MSQMPPPFVVFLRGIPGSGKTAFAQRLLYKLHKKHRSCSILSTDQYREKNGLYVYDETERANQVLRLKRDLQLAMRLEEIIIVDNCHTRMTEFMELFKLADAKKCVICIIDIMPNKPIDYYLSVQRHDLTRPELERKMQEYLDTEKDFIKLKNQGVGFYGDCESFKTKEMTRILLDYIDTISGAAIEA